ncbi:DUF2232 domain-containing protein [Clostridiaceae bacterium M8S5]|nr:DUF2232 domain-containing protein [Clostridiaceae bacterium M8S5]
MKHYEDTNKLVLSAAIIGIATILTILFINSFSIFLLLYPTVFIVLGVKADIKYCILSLVATSLLISMVTNIVIGIFIFVQFGLLAVVIAYMINKEYKLIEICIGGSVVCLLSMSVLIIAVSYVTQVDFIERVNVNLDIIIKFTKQDINKELTILTLPTVAILVSLIFTYVNYLLSVVILHRLKISTMTIPKFNRFRLPNNIILGTLVILILSVAIRYLKVFYYDTIFLNVMMLTSTFYFIQGLAVLMYFMKKLKVSKILVVIIVITLVLYLRASIIISMLGFIDALVDLRRLKKEAK